MSGWMVGLTHCVMMLLLNAVIVMRVRVEERSLGEVCGRYGYRCPLSDGFNNSSGAGTRHLEAVNFLSLSPSLSSLFSFRLSVNGPTNSETIFRTWHHVIADSAPISLCQE